MTTALIDGDLVAYRCAASAEQDDESIACIRASRLLQDIVSATDADTIQLFLSGSNNFRYAIYPEYKANRKDMKRPRHLQCVREFLVLKWGAEVTDGYEADDALGVEACKLFFSDRRTKGIICSLDKDLRQIPGGHFNFVSGSFDEVTELDGWRNFYSQLILGDKADNIPGFDGKSRPKWPKFLEGYRTQLRECNTPREMYEVVRSLYTSQQEQTLVRNARLLYIWRQINDQWQPPTTVGVMSEEKHETAENSASTVTTPEEIIPSTALTIGKVSRGGFRAHGRSTDTWLTKKRQDR